MSARDAPWMNNSLITASPSASLHGTQMDQESGVQEHPMSPPEAGTSMSGLQAMSVEYAQYHGYVAALVCVFGIVANLANIVVLTRKNMITSTNTILTWLAVADLITMTSYLPVSIHFYIMADWRFPFPSSLSVHWMRFMLFHISFAVVAHTIAIWLTIALAIFRYLFISHPTRGAELCSLQRAKLCVVAVYVLTCVVCTPNYLVTTIVQSTKHLRNGVVLPPSANITADNVSKVTYYEFGLSPLAEPFLEKFNFWIQAILIKLIPCLLLTALTVMLIVAMHQANQRRMKLKSQVNRDESERAREHNRTTVMLITIVGLFLLTELPQGILTMCAIFVPGFFMNVYTPLGDLLDIMALLNNSINFVLYCTMSRVFRQTFIETFGSWCTDRRPGWMKVKTVTIAKNGTQHTESTVTNNKMQTSNV